MIHLNIGISMYLVVLHVFLLITNVIQKKTQLLEAIVPACTTFDCEHCILENINFLNSICDKIDKANNLYQTDRRRHLRKLSL